MQQLLHNTINLARKNRKENIQLWGQAEDLKEFLIKEKFVIGSTQSNSINKKSNILILTEDVEDSTQRSEIETFIRSGGTLIFGSPLADIFKRDHYLQLSSFITKAGLYHVFNPINPKANNALNIDSVPWYLHITSILKVLKNNYNVPLKEEKNVILSTLLLPIALFGIDSPQATEIKKILALNDDSAFVPSEKNPFYVNNLKGFVKYNIQQFLIAQQLNDHPNLNYISPAAKYFPGEVPASAERVSKQITIPVKAGTQGLLEPQPVYYRWHSTGLYVAAGDKVKVTISLKDTLQYLKAQIGIHNDNLLHMDYFVREPTDLTKTFELSKETTVIYSPYGGILLINVPDTSTLKNIIVNVEGAVKYPYFKMGETTVSEWQNTIRNYPAPWAELATDKIILQKNLSVFFDKWKVPVTDKAKKEVSIYPEWVPDELK